MGIMLDIHNYIFETTIILKDNQNSLVMYVVMLRSEGLGRKGDRERAVEVWYKYSFNY